MLGSGLKPERIGLRKVLGACMVVDVDEMSAAHIEAVDRPPLHLLPFMNHLSIQALASAATCL